MGIYCHFQKAAPKPKVALAFRRPGLVIGSSLGVAAAGLLLAGIAWLARRAGDDSDTVVIMMVIGISTASAAGIVATIITAVVQPWKRHY